MKYLYKVYNYHTQPYERYIMTNEELWDTYTINLIHIFNHLDEDKEHKLLEILNKNALNSIELKLINVLDELKIN